jgi:molybdopterin converting factor small subunit
MRVRVLLFGPLKDDVGSSVVEVDLPAPGTVAALRTALAAKYPAKAPLLSRARIAVNQRFAQSEQPVTSADEIAVIELVSGG